MIQIIEEKLKMYTPDFHKYFTGTITEKMYHAGRESVLKELHAQYCEDEKIKDFIIDLKYALTHTEFCECKICNIIRSYSEEE